MCCRAKILFVHIHCYASHFLHLFQVICIDYVSVDKQVIMFLKKNNYYVYIFQPLLVSMSLLVMLAIICIDVRNKLESNSFIHSLFA